ncbi:hypothetical protein BDV19DRAFT_390091 [Aspergillus venezuelensis]
MTFDWDGQYDAAKQEYEGPPQESTVPGLTFPHKGGPELKSIVAKLFDDSIEKAAKLLNDAKLLPCTQDYHWHTDLFYPERPPHTTYGVFLYRKSRLFWTFPVPPIGRPKQDDPYYMLTSDKRITTMEYSRCRASDKDYPVKIPIPARYMEAMKLLELRDLDAQDTILHWDLEIDYLAEQIFNSKNPNLKIKDLAELFREWAKRCAFEEYAEEKKVFDGYCLRLELYAKMHRDLPPPERTGMGGLMPLEERMAEYGIPWPA